jgi:hypothetical protein
LRASRDHIEAGYRALVWRRVRGKLLSARAQTAASEGVAALGLWADAGITSHRLPVPQRLIRRPCPLDRLSVDLYRLGEGWRCRRAEPHVLVNRRNRFRSWPSWRIEVLLVLQDIARSRMGMAVVAAETARLSLIPEPIRPEGRAAIEEGDDPRLSLTKRVRSEPCFLPSVLGHPR